MQQRRSPRSPPINPGLLQLIPAKREWHWKPSIQELRRGFRGWHERGYLPHFEAPGVTQMVTFMLDDSFPITRRMEWEPILHEPDDSVKRRKLEAWLDRGHGECWLRLSKVAALVERELLEDDGVQFQLQSWVLMPNHVHLVVDVWDVPLSTLITKWKGRSSRLANRFLARTGAFWQKDYFDTLIRDDEHLQKAKRYTERNPVKAGLINSARDWKWSSAGRRDQYERLPWEIP